MSKDKMPEEEVQPVVESVVESVEEVKPVEKPVVINDLRNP